ncbi:18 kDa seed maturation protein-like [Punica granatum]|uniref:Uncharacterized protein n=2 Tax=Punica granatum TaxID=22663 RepID=A0A218X208_PUNGR|nr:18 kDa seed maturation protein-like [Punica granatum]OWM78964.1 hypothetical protein CDL15_Pgr003135 [Punica granatum]PKI42882.1 hypothetical protein CRG98_036680 [Punica granatum]
MQSAKEAVASAKESLADLGATARYNMEKAKATAQEQMDRMIANTQMDKDLATERKQERIDEAKLGTLEAYNQNAAAREQTAFIGQPGPMTTAGPHASGTHTSSTRG